MKGVNLTVLRLKGRLLWLLGNFFSREMPKNVSEERIKFPCIVYLNVSDFPVGNDHNVLLFQSFEL